MLAAGIAFGSGALTMFKRALLRVPSVAPPVTLFKTRLTVSVDSLATSVAMGIRMVLLISFATKLRLEERAE